MDIAALSANVDKVNKGAEMKIIDPRTMLPALDKSGKSYTITLLSADSDKLREHRRSATEKAINDVRAGIKASQEETEALGVEYLVAATVGWSFDTLGTEKFPFSPENARKFWADPRFRHIRAQADRFIQDVANFMQD